MQAEPNDARSANKSSTATSPSPLMSAAHSADSTVCPLTTANVATIASAFIILSLCCLINPCHPMPLTKTATFPTMIHVVVNASLTSSTQSCLYSSFRGVLDKKE